MKTTRQFTATKAGEFQRGAGGPLSACPPSRRSTAAALLIVLWAVVLLSMAVLGWARWIQQDLEMAGEANLQLEALAMAHSGVAVALHPMVTEQTPLLVQELGPGFGYRTRIIGEGGKPNINWLIAGEDPRKITILKQWLEMKGLNFQEREIFVDSLLDFVDGDNLRRASGMEDEGDYHPPNRPLESVEEIADVYGSRPLTRVPGWKDELTIDSRGPFDMSSAPPEVLALLPGLGDARIQRFVAFRRGKDAIDGTIDDNVFKTLEDIRQFLGLSEMQFQELGGLVTPKDETVRIIADGYSRKVIRQVVVVARKGAGGNPAILHWKE